MNKSNSPHSIQNEKQTLSTNLQTLLIGYNNAQSLGISKQKQLCDIVSKKSFNVIGLTETFLSETKPYTFIPKNYTWICKHRNTQAKKSGGGVGFLIDNSVVILDTNVSNSMNDSFERLWVKLKYGNSVFYIGIVYFPNDGKEYDLCCELSNELISNISSINSPNILLLGDFNGRAQPFREECRISKNGELLDNLVEVTGMTLVNCKDICKGMYTWRRNMQKSVIDYVLASTSLTHFITEMRIHDDLDISIGSDHHFITIDMVINSEPPKKAQTGNTIKSWNIKENTDWRQFALMLEKSLSAWDVDHNLPIDTTWEKWKNAVISAGTSSVGFKNTSQRCFWDGEVTKLIKDRRTANRIHRKWLNAGAPVSLINELWEDYQHKKSLAAKYIKKKEVERKIKTIVSNAKKKSSSTRSYWRTLKSMNSRNNSPIQIQDPENPTKILDDPVDIKKALTRYWHNLSNKQCSDESKSRINDLNNDDKIYDDCVNEFTINETAIDTAIKKLKVGKACGDDQIPAEFIKYGGPCMRTTLLKIFKLCYDKESYPSQWLKGIIKPIHKSGSKYNLDNYRGITLTSIVYKLYASILEGDLMAHLEDKNVIGDLQGAFRKNRRVEDHIFTLKNICNIRKTKKEKTHLAFIDVSKAFDTVDRNQLFIELWDKGIRSKSWRTMFNLYKNVSAKVLLSQVESDWFYVSSGVKQGCILSPTLFNLVMRNLQDLLEKAKCGILFKEMLIPALLFADDIVLMANSDDELQKMLNIVDNFGKRWSLSFSEKKSKVMITGQRINKTKIWKLGHLNLSEVYEYKYLGVYFSRSLKDNRHISNLKTKFTKLNGYIASILSKHMDINRMEFGSSLWHNVVMPSLTYGCGVWFNGTASDKQLLSSMQYNCARQILKLRCKPAKSALLSDIGWLPIEHHLDNLRFNYFIWLKNNVDKERLVYKVFQEVMNSDNCIYKQQLQQVMNNRGLDFMCNINSSVCNNLSFKVIGRTMFKNSMIEDFQEKSTLQHYKALKNNTFAEPYLYEKDNFKGAQLKFKARVGCLGLEADLEKRGMSDGICKRCSLGTKDTMEHFLLNCSSLDNERNTLETNIYCNLKNNNRLNIWNTFINGNNLAKIKFLLGSHSDNMIYSVVDNNIKLFLTNYEKMKLSNKH